MATVLLLTLSGFAVVDMSAERYMPGGFGAMFQVSGLDANGVRFSWMGTSYRVDAAPLKTGLELLWENAALLPLPPRVAAALSRAGWQRWAEWRHAQRQMQADLGE